MTTDYLILGQGLAGTFLSYYLQRAGKKVLVIDGSRPFTASKVASGVINPVTGRRIVRTWRIEELLPFAHDAYVELGNEIGEQLVKMVDVLDFHPSLQMKEAFEKRLPEETEYLHRSHEGDWKDAFNFYFGVGAVSPCLLVDIKTMLEKWRAKLVADEALLEEQFDWDLLKLDAEGVSYKGISAKKIFCCEGVDGTHNPYFRNLPYAPNKGEAIIAHIPGLSPDYIYKQGLSIVPLSRDLFWIGSSYEWDFTHPHPTEAFRQKVINQLQFWLKLPFEIIDHIASIRPANMERRPFVGVHPKHEAVGILNGMGTKGCSIAPFFSKQLADHLVEGKQIYPDADVRRFEKVLAREMK